jgi:hypothetical protein
LGVSLLFGVPFFFGVPLLFGVPLFFGVLGPSPLLLLGEFVKDL